MFNSEEYFEKLINDQLYKDMIGRLEKRKEEAKITIWKHKEPQKIWGHAGFTCMTIYGPVGNLNGYVIVPESHLWYKLHYSECPINCTESWCDHRPESIITVHGGITFSGLIPSGWVFGFDTSHCDDFVIYSGGFVMEGKIWEDEEVEAEVNKMADQLKEFMV